MSSFSNEVNSYIMDLESVLYGLLDYLVIVAMESDGSDIHSEILGSALRRLPYKYKEHISDELLNRIENVIPDSYKGSR